MACMQWQCGPRSLVVGRVALDAYYSAADLDFWVLASAESRTEALQRGYKLVGTVGYGYALSSE